MRAGMSTASAFSGALRAIIFAKVANESPVSREKIREVALNFKSCFVANVSGDIPDDFFEQELQAIESELLVEMDLGLGVESSEFQPWYAPEDKGAFLYWGRFKQYLIQKKGRGPAYVDALDTRTDWILSRLGNPASEFEFSRKGLVIGDVQSGKTNEFTALCNKAADVGYRVFIILTSSIEALRKQTQERLDLEFLGVRSDANDVNYAVNGRGHKDLPAYGVSEFNNLIKNKPISLTKVSADFDARLGGSGAANIPLDVACASTPVLMVVKKNAHILRNLCKWVSPTGMKGYVRSPALVIDDEADYASPNTGSEHNPRAINAGIRELLSYFYKVNYVAVTATPFANVFINPDTEDEMFGDDLFPRDFVYTLSPPSSYVGLSAIFGDLDGCGDDSLEQITDLEAVLPAKHKKDTIVECLPDSLIDAIGYFLLVNALLDATSAPVVHRSMLVHISHFTQVHGLLASDVATVVNSFRNEVRNYGALPEKEALDNHRQIRRLREIWDTHGLRRKAPSISWESLQQKFLYEAIRNIEVATVNSRGTALVYPNGESVRVIAVGGNSLARGLTLEGLMVSYFRRTTMMCDSLLQMGRWFGYRPEYRQFCKIWMTPELIERYQEIAEMYEEFKGAVASMQKANQSPNDYGMRVRCMEDALLPTARNKMKTAQTMTRPVNIAMHLLETPRLLDTTLDENEVLIQKFVYRLNEWGERDTTVTRPYWRNVDKSLVADLVRGFQTDPWSLHFLAPDIADHIEESEDNPLWDVAIVGGDAKCDAYDFKMSDGSRLHVTPGARQITRDGRHSLLVSGGKRRVGSGGAGRIGLSANEVQLVREMFVSYRKGANQRVANLTPDNWYFHAEVRKRPLLIIHVLVTESIEELKGRKIFAIGTGFPGYPDDLRLVRYHVNLVEWRNMNKEHGVEEDEEE